LADEAFQPFWPQAGPRVAIVDDHGAMRAALRDALEDEGATVVGEADDGPAGVELSVRLEPDVVLMDLRMPGTSGLEATRQIRQLRPAVQVLILTAYDDPALDREATAVGAYAFLVKGCQVERICEVADQAWAHARNREAEPPLSRTATAEGG
jgi:DNA-binding NarL/FixJ family response regulator